MDIDARLGLDVFKIDKETHIVVEKSPCPSCEGRPCLRVCPAKVYTEGEGGKILARYEGCLECGTCLIACPSPGVLLKWKYPRGGFGVHYRFG
jgi:ferredoxin like protein